MGSLKMLRGVAHDIGHHAQSGLSYLYPHLGEACRLAGCESAEVELLQAEPYPAGLPRMRPLALALAALRRRFLEILERAGLATSDVQSARLRFVFPPEPRDDSLYGVQVALMASDGRTYEHALPPMGRSSFA